MEELSDSGGRNASHLYQPESSFFHDTLVLPAFRGFVIALLGNTPSELCIQSDGSNGIISIRMQCQSHSLAGDCLTVV